jgi:micrococcal nuclease
MINKFAFIEGLLGGKTMKKVSLILFIIVLLSVTGSSQAAKSMDKVRLVKCTDGDTARFSGAGATRFLYVDTPESVNQVEPFGKEASAFTCSKLTNAKTIQLEYDGPSRTDMYGRTLAWVWVDGKLLQLLLVQKGYVEKFYDFGTYKYEKLLISEQKIAMSKKIGLWGKSNLSVTATPVSSSQTTFKNCTELKKVYPNGVPKSHPAYQSKMDRDKDGYACEPPNQ